MIDVFESLRAVTLIESAEMAISGRKCNASFVQQILNALLSRIILHLPCLMQSILQVAKGKNSCKETNALK